MTAGSNASRFLRGLRKGDNAKAVADRGGQRIEAVGGGDVRDLAEIDGHLQGRIRVTHTGLRLEESENAVPQPAIVGAGAGFLDLVQKHHGIGVPGLADRQKRVARLGRVPAPVGACENGAVRPRGVGAPDAEAEHLAEPPGKAGFAASGVSDQQQRAQQDDGSSDEVGERKVDHVDGIGKLEYQTLADRMQRRHRHQRQRDVDDVLQGADHLLDLDVLHLLVAEVGNHETVFGRFNRARCRAAFDDLIGFGLVDGPLGPFFSILNLLPDRGFGGSDAVLGHLASKPYRAGCGPSKR